jgi:hypothetical protein
VPRFVGTTTISPFSFYDLPRSAECSCWRVHHQKVLAVLYDWVLAVYYMKLMMSTFTVP